MNSKPSYEELEKKIKKLENQASRKNRKISHVLKSRGKSGI